MMKNAKNSAIIVRFVDLHGGIGSGLVWLMLQTVHPADAAGVTTSCNKRFVQLLHLRVLLFSVTREDRQKSRTFQTQESGNFLFFDALILQSRFGNRAVQMHGDSRILCNKLCTISINPSFFACSHMVSINPICQHLSECSTSTRNNRSYKHLPR
jgi:hypothetical protein